MTEQLAPSRVDRPWLIQALGVQAEDPERWVDILHARYASTPPASRAQIGKTLGISTQTVARREREALAVLQAQPLEELTGADALHEDDLLYSAVASGAEDAESGSHGQHGASDADAEESDPQAGEEIPTPLTQGPTPQE